MVRSGPHACGHVNAARVHVHAATLSTVPFPVDAYMRRIDGVAQHVRACLDAKSLLPKDGHRPDPRLVLQVRSTA